jgi:DNA-binding beta-propeller fold protein YncE
MTLGSGRPGAATRRGHVVFPLGAESRPARLVVAVLSVLVFGFLVPGCSAAPAAPPPVQTSATSVGSAPTSAAPTAGQPARPSPPSADSPPFRDPLPGMPPATGNDVYAATRAGMLSPKVAGDPALLYVPDAIGSSVTVISQRTRKIVRVLKAGQMSQHVTPAYGLQTLYVNSSAANALVTINPRNGKEGRRIAVPRPYNLYFTPDGKQAVVMVEQRNQILFADPRTFKRIAARTIPGCSGPNHADFSANGRYFLVTCEFSGAVAKVSTESHQVLGLLKLGRTSMPQDIRLSPDGRIFYLADMGVDRVRMIAGDQFRLVGAIATPKQPHGLYPSRDGRFLYVSDRGAGKVSVISFATEKIVATWTIPGGGSPDMGGVSADGGMLWLSGRYNGVVYGFDTHRGRLVAKIRVGGNPHGLAVWPQPGRYSLGHTGNMR